MSNSCPWGRKEALWVIGTARACLMILAQFGHSALLGGAASTGEDRIIYSLKWSGEVREQGVNKEEHVQSSMLSRNNVYKEKKLLGKVVKDLQLTVPNTKNSIMLLWQNQGLYQDTKPKALCNASILLSTAEVSAGRPCPL